MSLKHIYTADDVRKAAAEIKDEMPFYNPILDFFEELFAAQEEFKAGLDLSPVTMDEDLLAAKMKEKKPLTDLSEFVPDKVKTEEMMKNIIGLALKENKVLAGGAEKLSAALKNGSLQTGSLIKGALAEETESFAQAAEGLDMPTDLLYFFVYNSIKPMVTLHAEQTASLLEHGEKHRKGYCPVCGSHPALSIFGEEGERYFSCSLCAHTWSTERIYCPFCENTDSGNLKYFYAASEEAYRVDTCRSCGKYLKTIDTRKLPRTLYPPLELVSTMHLDLKASELGFASGTRLPFQAE